MTHVIFYIIAVSFMWRWIKGVKAPQEKSDDRKEQDQKYEKKESEVLLVNGKLIGHGYKLKLSQMVI